MTFSTHPFELLTPCFAGGANPTAGVAEIRPSSIRGLLRWWFRIVGGSRTEEAEVFGRAAGASGVASALVIRVSNTQGIGTPQDLLEYTGANEENEALRHEESYFLWPLRRKKHSCLRPNRDNIARFDLHLGWRRPVLSSVREKLELAFALWSMLGAIGSRSLKGYGSVWPCLQMPTTESELAGKLSALPPGSVRIWRDRLQNPRAGLAFAATELRRLRCGTNRFAHYGLHPSTHGQPDHDTAANVLNGNPGVNSVFRPVLGLPLKQTFGNGTVETNWNGVSRLASPMHIKIGRLDTGYCVLSVFFDAKAIQHGDTLTLDTGNRSKPVTLDWGLWNHIKTLGRPLR